MKKEDVVFLVDTNQEIWELVKRLDLKLEMVFNSSHRCHSIKSFINQVENLIEPDDEFLAEDLRINDLELSKNSDFNPSENLIRSQHMGTEY